VSLAERHQFGPIRVNKNVMPKLKFVIMSPVRLLLL
jgi:hypothetical protein